MTAAGDGETLWVTGKGRGCEEVMILIVKGWWEDVKGDGEEDGYDEVVVMVVNASAVMYLIV